MNQRIIPAELRLILSSFRYQLDVGRKSDKFNVLCLVLDIVLVFSEPFAIVQSMSVICGESAYHSSYIATRLRGGHPRHCYSIPGRDNKMFCSSKFPERPWVHSTSYTIVTGGFPWVQIGRNMNLISRPYPNAEVKNERRCISTPSCAFMACKWKISPLHLCLL